jgi:hypothetical protein
MLVRSVYFSSLRDYKASPHRYNQRGIYRWLHFLPGPTAPGDPEVKESRRGKLVRLIALLRFQLLFIIALLFLGLFSGSLPMVSNLFEELIGFWGALQSSCWRKIATGGCPKACSDPTPWTAIPVSDPHWRCWATKGRSANKPKSHSVTIVEIRQFPYIAPTVVDPLRKNGHGVTKGLSAELLGPPITFLNVRDPTHYKQRIWNWNY